MSSIYIAGHFARQASLRSVATVLRSMGHVVTSRWLDEVGHPTPDSTHWYSIGERDLEDIRAADCLLLDTTDITPRGGREFETGYAHALGKPFYILGPHRSVFHYRAAAVFASTTDLLRFFEGGAPDAL